MDRACAGLRLRLMVRPDTVWRRHQSANQKYRDRVWLPAEGISSFDEKELEKDQSVSTTRTSQSRELVQPERYFNRHTYRHDLAVRSGRRPELPRAHGLYRLFSESHSGILQDRNIHRPAVRRNGHLQYNSAHVLRFARVVRIERWRAIDALRHADSIDAGAKRAATRASPFARTEPAAGTAADPGAIAMTKRIAHAIGQGIAKIRRVEIRHL